jgi:hypothetical protein
MTVNGQQALKKGVTELSDPYLGLANSDEGVAT